MRKFTFVATALVSVFGVLFLAAPGVEAAVAHDNTSRDLAFDDYNDLPANCTVSNDSAHNTDNPNQPFTVVTDSTGGDSNACTDSFKAVITVNYKDKDGVDRTSSFTTFGQGSAQVGGTYSNISTSVTVTFGRCDVGRYTCDVSVPAHPK